MRTKQAKWISVRFQINSGAVRMKYEHNKDQRYVNEPKMAHVNTQVNA